VTVIIIIMIFTVVMFPVIFLVMMVRALVPHRVAIAAVIRAITQEPTRGNDE